MGVPPPCQGSGRRPEPPEAFSWQEKKGKRSAPTADRGRFGGPSPPHSSNMRPGGKGERGAGTRSGFSFLSLVLLPKLLLGVGEGGKGEGCMTPKGLLRAYAHLVPQNHQAAG